jgi:hypothetical protein
MAIWETQLPAQLGFVSAAVQEQKNEYGNLMKFSSCPNRFENAKGQWETLANLSLKPSIIK